MDFYNPFFPIYQLIPLFFFVMLLALAFVGLYFVVRAAVRRALQEHQLWLDSRGGGGNPPQS